MVLRERPGSLFLGCSGILWDNHRVPYVIVSVGESLCRRDTPLLLLGAGSGVSVQAVIILITVSFPAPKGVEVEGSKSNSLLLFFFNLVTGGLENPAGHWGVMGSKCLFSSSGFSFKLGFLSLITGKGKDDPEFLSKGRKG